jgi:beta-lactamase regulating signal transducer with metallopeptidase domain
MLQIISLAAVRSLLLGLVVLAALRVLRVRNSFVLKAVWIAVLLACVSMPLIMQFQSVSIPHTTLASIGISPPVAEVVAANALNKGHLILAGLYAGIAALLLLRLTIGIVRAARLSRDARPISLSRHDHDAIRISPLIRAPATFGRTILLPEGFPHWSKEELNAVLSHERAHVRHLDSYVQWLALFHRAIFWINPLAWWLPIRIAELAEHTSDAAALEQSVSREAYLTILKEMSMPRRLSKALVPMAIRETVEARIAQIRANPTRFVRPHRGHRLAALLLVLPVTALIGGASLAQTPHGKGPNEPRLLSTGDLKPWYPARARTEHVEGLVTVSVTLDAKGQPVEAHVLREVPEGYGFGESSVVAAKVFKYSNPSGKTVATSFNIKFALGS